MKFFDRWTGGDLGKVSRKEDHPSVRANATEIETLQQEREEAKATFDRALQAMTEEVTMRGEQARRRQFLQECRDNLSDVEKILAKALAKRQRELKEAQDEIDAAELEELKPLVEEGIDLHRAMISLNEKILRRCENTKWRYRFQFPWLTKTNGGESPLDAYCFNYYRETAPPKEPPQIGTFSPEQIADIDRRAAEFEQQQQRLGPPRII